MLQAFVSKRLIGHYQGAMHRDTWPCSGADSPLPSQEGIEQAQRCLRGQDELSGSLGELPRLEAWSFVLNQRFKSAAKPSNVKEDKVLLLRLGCRQKFYVFNEN